MFNRFLLYTFLSLVSPQVQSATYYFSSYGGIDTRSNQEATNPRSPWKSIEKLNSIFSTFLPGDSILFKSGETFHGNLKIIKSGSLKAPIYLGRYGSGTKPTLTGFREITEWIHKGDNLYEAIVSELNFPLSVLTIDNSIFPMGRYPNENENKSGYLITQSYKNGHIETNHSQPYPNFSGAEIVIRKNNWIIDRHLINSITSLGFIFTPIENQNVPMVGYGFFIQNHPTTLDKHGEWYFDKVNKTLLIYFEGDPSKAHIKVSTLPEIITIRNKTSNIVIENISIEGSNENLINLISTSNLRLTNCELDYIGRNAINSNSSRNLTITNTSIKNSLNGGVFLGWNDLGFTLKNSNFENIYMFAGMGQNGEMQSQAIYMSETTSNALIEANKFYNCGYNAINFSGSNIIIKNNLIDTFCFNKDDGAGIYTFTGPSKIIFVNRKIIGNIIINGIGAIQGTKPYGINDLPYVEGIYLDQNSSGIEIHGNTIANIKGKGIYLNNARNITITDNKILNTGYSIYLKSDDLEKHSNKIIVKNNDFLATTKTQLHFYIRTNFDDISLIGTFENNIFSRPLNISQTIYFQTPSINGPIDLISWKKNYGLDENSSIGPVESILIHPNEKKLAKMTSSILFDFNYSDSPKSLSLLGSFIDLRGHKVIELKEIPAYSSIVLLKTRNIP